MSSDKGRACSSPSQVHTGAGIVVIHHALEVDAANLAGPFVGLALNLALANRQLRGRFVEVTSGMAFDDRTLRLRCDRRGLLPRGVAPQTPRRKDEQHHGDGQEACHVRQEGERES